MGFGVIQFIKNIAGRQKSVLTALQNIAGDGISIRRNPDLNCISEMFSKKIKLFKIVDKETKLTTKYAGCHFNDMRELESIFIYNRAEKNIDVFTKTGECILQYTADETEALMRYKHNSRNIHRVLRENIKVKNQEETENCIKNISGIYENGKASIAKSDIISYRALDKFTLKNILPLREGDVLEMPSFTSVATNRKKIIQFLNFRNFLHPLEITIPKNTKYISIDEIHNIIIPNKPETELLLKKGGTLLITAKPKFGKIKGIYIEGQNNILPQS